MKAYVTQFAFTLGIFIVDGDTDTFNPKALVVNNSGFSDIYLKPNWYLTAEEAKAWVESIIDKEREDLYNRLDELYSSKFLSTALYIEGEDTNGEG